MCILPHFFSVVKWCNFFYFSSFLASIFFLYFFFLTPCFWVFFVFMQFCGVFSPSTWVSTTTYHIFSLNKYCFCVLDFYLKKYTCLSCLLAFISVHYLSELVRSTGCLKIKWTFLKLQSSVIINTCNFISEFLYLI